MRKISRTLALMGLLAPLGANALGIGDIRLHSALNQSLDAEIPLVLSGGDEISELRVAIASPEAFARAGIERHYSLSKLRFAPQQKADGTYVIKVSSQDSIREPILDFIIEVHWPQGRVQREFTVLLDPPASFSETASADADVPMVESYRRPPEPVSRPMRPAPESPRRPTRESSHAEAPAAAEVPISGEQYGPIGKNETLWSIAKQFNHDGAVGQEKMLQALYRANPRAFYKNSINALKAGETITIPDRETIARLAGASVHGNAGRLASRPSSRAGTAEGEASQGQLELLAPSTGKSRDEMAGASGKIDKIREEIEREIADTFKQKIEEINRRLDDVEQKNTELQRLLNLKDGQLAAIQAQQRQAGKPPLAEQPPVTPPSSVVPPTSEVAKPPVEEQALGKELPPTVPPGQPAELPVKPPVEAIPTAPPAQPVVPPSQAVAPPPVQVKRPPPVTPPPVKQPPAPVKAEKGMLEEWLDQPAYTIIGEAGVLALLATAVVLGYKRRRSAMIDDTESILTLSDREKTFQPKRASAHLDLPTGAVSETPTTARSSFLSEFTPSDFDALGGEMEEVDPISEADVYLAYGRYKQAEELIRGAIAQNPERDECKLKLLEIHYATENAQAFEKFAQELAPTHRESKPGFWEKVVEMGQELCPDSSLFGTGAVHGSSRAGSADVLETEDLFQKQGGESHPSSLAEATRSPPPTERPQADAYDFLPSETAELEPDKGMEEEGQRLPRHDVDNNVIALDSSQISLGNEAKEHDKTLDDILAELGVLSESSPKKPGSGGDEAKESNSIEFDLEGYGRMQGAEEDESPRYDDESGEYMALTEMDEQETKLDLAKAYFDMGDDEAARVILESVAENGNDTQKQEAWSLLNRLTRKEVNRR